MVPGEDFLEGGRLLFCLNLGCWARASKLVLQVHNVVHLGITLELLVHLTVENDLDARLFCGDLAVE